MKINLKPKSAFLWRMLCTICMVALLGNSVFAQKVDTSKISFKPKAKVISRVPVIKANITPYKPNTVSFGNTSSASTPTKTSKMLVVLKVYPNPVNEQVNISFRLDRESILSIKITDMLSNDVLILANERTPAGEQTKTFTIPNKLNPGIYFLKINAGGDQIIKRISVL